MNDSRSLSPSSSLVSLTLSLTTRTSSPFQISRLENNHDKDSDTLNDLQTEVRSLSPSSPPFVELTFPLLLSSFQNSSLDAELTSTKAELTEAQTDAAQQHGLNGIVIAERDRAVAEKEQAEKSFTEAEGSVRSLPNHFF